MIVTRWQLANTSSRRWRDEQHGGASARSVRTTSNSRSTSMPVSAAVGSSMTITVASNEIALAISTICWSATDRPRAGRVGSRATPRRLEHLGRRGVHRAAVDAAAPAERLAAHEDVLGDAQVGEQRRLLVDHRDPAARDAAGPAEHRRLAVDAQLAAVGLMDAGEDLHQGRLAGAVLAEQGVHLATAQQDRSVDERADRAERLRRTVELQRDGHWCTFTPYDVSDPLLVHQ